MSVLDTIEFPACLYGERKFTSRSWKKAFTRAFKSPESRTPFGDLELRSVVECCGPIIFNRQIGPEILPPNWNLFHVAESMDKKPFLTAIGAQPNPVSQFIFDAMAHFWFCVALIGSHGGIYAIDKILIQHRAVVMERLLGWTSEIRALADRPYGDRTWDRPQSLWQKDWACWCTRFLWVLAMRTWPDRFRDKEAVDDEGRRLMVTINRQLLADPITSAALGDKWEELSIWDALLQRGIIERQHGRFGLRLTVETKE